MSNDQSFKNRKPGMGKAEPGTIKRIFSYIFQYKWRVVAIVICILIGAAAQAGSALFLQSLIDTYILPMVGETNPDWAPLLRAISLMGCLYLAGIVASWAWQWLIVTVEQGTLKKIRDDMFAHQQKLPIRYFDSHEHGDIMSHYTNDTDTLRQAISQSFPQMFSSIISALAALLSMLWLSIPFTAFVIVFTVLLYFIVRKIVSRSGRYFVKQQMWIGDVNAFVEESVNGQKVIKVFNHEDATQKTFDEKNEELFEASAEANTWGNVTMPVVGNMGYLLYILLAIIGAAVSLAGVNDLGLTGVKPLTLGTLVSLLTLSRSFINPIGQVSQQLTMVMMRSPALPNLQADGRARGVRQRHRHARQRRARRGRPYHGGGRPRDRPLGVEARGRRRRHEVAQGRRETARIRARSGRQGQGAGDYLAGRPLHVAARRCAAHT